MRPAGQMGGWFRIADIDSQAQPDLAVWLTCREVRKGRVAWVRCQSASAKPVRNPGRPCEPVQGWNPPSSNVARLVLSGPDSASMVGASASQASRGRDSNHLAVACSGPRGAFDPQAKSNGDLNFVRRHD